MAQNKHWFSHRNSLVGNDERENMQIFCVKFQDMKGADITEAGEIASGGCTWARALMFETPAKG